MRRLIAFTSMIMLLFCLLLGVTRGVGNLHPSPFATMFQSENCPLWECWNGIRLGMTVEEVREKLIADNNLVIVGYTPFPADEKYIVATLPAPPTSKICWWTTELHSSDEQNCFSKDTYGRGALLAQYPERDLRLGDFIALFGLPKTVSRCRNTGHLNFWNPIFRITADIDVEIDNLQESIISNQTISSVHTWDQAPSAALVTLNGYFRVSGFMRWQNIPGSCSP